MSVLKTKKRKNLWKNIFVKSAKKYSKPKARKKSGKIKSTVIAGK